MLDNSKLDSERKKIHLKMNAVLEFAWVTEEGRWKESKCQQQIYCLTGSDFQYDENYMVDTTYCLWKDFSKLLNWIQSSPSE